MPEGLGEEGQKDLLGRLSSALRWKTQLNIALEPVGMGTLPRYQVKAKRFHDRRSKP